VPGRAKATYGTGVFVLANTGHEQVSGIHGAGLLPTIAWRIAGRDCGALDGGVFSAGSLLEWLSKDMGLATDVPALVALAASVRDAAGVRILPALGGLGAPWWRPEARGVIAGLSANSRPAHIARAALDGIVQRVGDIVRAADLVMPIEDLRIDGGLTRAPGFAERPHWPLSAPASSPASRTSIRCCRRSSGSILIGPSRRPTSAPGPASWNVPWSSSTDPDRDATEVSPDATLTWRRGRSSIRVRRRGAMVRRREPSRRRDP
jgi:glycerol kinase